MNFVHVYSMFLDGNISFESLWKPIIIFIKTPTKTWKDLEERQKIVQNGLKRVNTNRRTNAATLKTFRPWESHNFCVQARIDMILKPY